MLAYASEKSLADANLGLKVGVGTRWISSRTSYGNGSCAVFAEKASPMAVPARTVHLSTGGGVVAREAEAHQVRGGQADRLSGWSRRSTIPSMVAFRESPDGGQERGRWGRLLDAARGLETVNAGHHQIHQHDARRVL